MIQGILRIGFEDFDLHRISLGAYDFNTAALRCYQSSGFVHEGLQRDVLRYENEWWSLIEMGILKSEWQGLQQA
jgi:RimJ/RimL family protein N-acetyltransferase